jgi:Type III secretion protein (HpaP)
MKADRPDPRAAAPRDATARAATTSPLQDEASIGFFASLLGRLRSKKADPDWADAVPAEQASPRRDDPAANLDATAPQPEPLPQPRAPAPAALPRDPPQRAVEAIDSGARQAAVGAADAPTSGRRVVEQLVSSISDFCNDPATQGREGWTVRIELSPELLPQTELEMNLSPQWLLLRFMPRDPTSRALVCAESGSLQKDLADTINPRRDVVVDIE